uniref:Uncharacterized protein n=1 Tax=Physcomitrium patens TaxID=3218 RepID=A0A2K1K443_PHYPA|nr:hypothetical protein PHYPA_013015 [Physcomitrium patens]
MPVPRILDQLSFDLLSPHTEYRCFARPRFVVAQQPFRWVKVRLCFAAMKRVAFRVKPNSLVSSTGYGDAGISRCPLATSGNMFV